LEVLSIIAPSYVTSPKWSQLHSVESNVDARPALIFQILTVSRTTNSSPCIMAPTAAPISLLLAITKSHLHLFQHHVVPFNGIFFTHGTTASH
jgi:hypothetical protein